MFNRRDNPNALVGLLLLILLGVFAGPTVLPEMIADFLPFADEGVPCHWLRDGSVRSQQQSLIGRIVSSNSSRSPISLQVRMDPIGSDQSVTITIVVTNETVGTIPILVTEGELILNPQEARNGLGVVFGQASVTQSSGETAGTYPPERIRLLGPRQLCIHKVTVPLNAIANSSALVAENVTATAFYRNNSAGSLQLTGSSVYPDQGLWVGLVQSPPTLVNAR